ncbi:MAG TPA: hypothetical protein VN520_35040 [Streptomyces sp.]|nr:hypothetical protein [Streptomyces sp.]HWU11513.1 hypothetical protein [Streptomyces sp.]
MQFFLSESPWEAEQVNDRRLELPRKQPTTARTAVYARPPFARGRSDPAFRTKPQPSATLAARADSPAVPP